MDHRLHHVLFANRCSRLASNALQNVEFVHTGSYLLDEVLGGGWVQGRIIEVYGPESSGKTIFSLRIVSMMFSFFTLLA